MDLKTRTTHTKLTRINKIVLKRDDSKVGQSKLDNGYIKYNRNLIGEVNNKP